MGIPIDSSGSYASEERESEIAPRTWGELLRWFMADMIGNVSRLPAQLRILYAVWLVVSVGIASCAFWLGYLVRAAFPYLEPRMPARRCRPFLRMPVRNCDGRVALSAR